ncbi:MAG: hypothetical protein Q7T26_04490 [Dehalococcoidia bacterium]|nr:hypothetical protein [Dehalococcoidia bacterium]
MSTLANALRRQQWDLAALCLAEGALRAAGRLPADALEGLLDSLEGGDADGRQR